MRLIDADVLKVTKIVERKRKLFADGRARKVNDWTDVVLLEDIENAPTIDQYGTWIPVTERLPGYKLCLITQKVGTQKVRKVALRVLGEWKFNGRKIKDEAVIAWMPLPLPYREGKDDE